MYKSSPKNISSLLVAVVCAIVLATLLAHSGPSLLAALLSSVITVLLLQVAFLRRDLSTLQDQISDHQKN